MPQFVIPVAQAVGTFLMNPYTQAAIFALSTGATIYGQQQAAKAEQRAAESYAGQLDANAKQERALAQLQLARRRRADKAQLSEQKSLAAAMGLTADSPTLTNLVSETIGEQTLQQMLEYSQGEDKARQLEFEAKSARHGGAMKRTAANYESAATLMQSTGSWYDRFGPGGSSSTGAKTGKVRSPTTMTKPRYGGGYAPTGKVRAG